MITGKEIKEWGNLTEDEKVVASYAINRFGTGCHPCPESHNLKFFQLPYARECLCKAVEESELTELGKTRANSALVKLGG